jgi:hypothetical protein
MIDVILERVLQAFLLHRTFVTDFLGDEHAHAITRKKDFRGVIAALGLGHPLGSHLHPLMVRVSFRVPT